MTYLTDILDELGMRPRPGRVKVENGIVEKQFNLPRHISALWAAWEGKLLLTPKQRYELEKSRIQTFQQAGLEYTPELVGADDENLVLKWKALPGLLSFVRVLKSRKTGFDQKLEYFRRALELLHAIHELGDAHGDAYLKNFYLNNDGVYTCDFEEYRSSPNPHVNDLLIFLANSASALGRFRPDALDALIPLTKDRYGPLPPHRFSSEEAYFYSVRFGMGARFFDYFSRGAGINSFPKHHKTS